MLQVNKHIMQIRMLTLTGGMLPCIPKRIRGELRMQNRQVIWVGHCHRESSCKAALLLALLSFLESNNKRVLYWNS